MAINVIDWVWRHSQSAGIDRLVLLAIADSAHDDGGGAWPSVPTLSRKANISKRTVQRSLLALVGLGELSIRYGAGEKGQNVYRIHMRPPRQDDTPVSLTPPSQSHPRQAVTGVTESRTPRQADTQTVLESKDSSSEPSARTRILINDDEPTPDVVRLCTLLADLMQVNDPDNKRPNIGKNWYRDCRLILTADKRPVAKVEAAIRWSQQNSFWLTNIHSMASLRKSYARMAQAASEEQKKAKTEPVKPAWQADREYQQNRFGGLA